MLPIMNLSNKNIHDEFALFREVKQHITIAPKLGDLRLKKYVERNQKH